MAATIAEGHLPVSRGVPLWGQDFDGRVGDNDSWGHVIHLEAPGDFRLKMVTAAEQTRRAP